MMMIVSQGAELLVEFNVAQTLLFTHCEESIVSLMNIRNDSYRPSLHDESKLDSVRNDTNVRRSVRLQTLIYNVRSRVKIISLLCRFELARRGTWKSTDSEVCAFC